MNRDREALTRLVAAVERCATASERRDFVSSIDEGRSLQDEVDAAREALALPVGGGVEEGHWIPAPLATRLLDYLYNPFEPKNQGRVYLDLKAALSPRMGLGK